MESHTACVGWGKLRAHTKMVPTGARVVAGDLLSWPSTSSPAPQRVTLSGMNTKQILNNQANKAVKPFQKEVNKQYIIIITRATLHLD